MFTVWIFANLKFGVWTEFTVLQLFLLGQNSCIENVWTPTGKNIFTYHVYTGLYCEPRHGNENSLTWKCRRDILLWVDVHIRVHTPSADIQYHVPADMTLIWFCGILLQRDHKLSCFGHGSSEYLPHFIASTPCNTKFIFRSCNTSVYNLPSPSSLRSPRLSVTTVMTLSVGKDFKFPTTPKKP